MGGYRFGYCLSGIAACVARLVDVVLLNCNELKETKMHIKINSGKNLVLISVLSLLTSGVLAMPFAWAGKPSSAAVVQAASVTSVFSVPSMSCGDKACETAIYIALHRIPGVQHIHIDDMKRTVTVTYDAKKVSPSVLLKTFRNIGYPASLAHA
jgi:mercuric ion binding protein